MAKLNIERTRKALQSFDFKTLFIEELGWSNPTSNKTIKETIKEIAISCKPIAELSGAVVFEITTPNGEVPEPKQRMAIAKEIQKQHFEHVLIFIDKDRKQSIWHWLKNQDKKVVSREHFFFRHQPGDGFIAKIASLVVDISEFDREGNIAIAEVASRIKTALDIERVVKRFFRDYQNEYIVFLDLIEGIDNEADRRWYASVILNRLMFIYFLQKKMFLDNGDSEYLNHKLEFSKKELGKNKFYNEFLSKLFFEGFAKQENQRSAATNKLIGKIKYLNGGLFLLHKIEVKYQGKISIPDQAFDNLIELFNRYSWTLDDTPGGADNEMNPDVLGYIFEKYINQKAFGAYYTRTEITEYLCEQTVYKLILDEVNGGELTDYIPEKLKQKLTTKRYDSIAELLLHLDAATCRKLVVGENAVLPNLSLLDPACGSGAFLVAAMKTLINVYSAILGKIEFLGDKKLTQWKQQIEKDHPSINYYIKKQIITNNLYGVDLMEEATEIAKLRLFLALVASAETVDQLEPLPNIDFNIMSGNSLIGLMRVDESEFNKHQSGDLFKKSYRELVNQKEAAIRAFKSFESTNENIQIKKESIDRMEEEANATLNLMLGQEFSNLGIKYEQITWDDKKNKEGKNIKRSVNIKDIQDLEPFHWGYEFSEIFRKKDGFDAIITNPPWEVFQTNEKEFFQEYNKEIKKKKLRIEDWEQNKEELMTDKEIRQAWLEYSSQYPHQWAYFKNAKQYKNQISVVKGKAVGNKPNLYCLFTEQCRNLLRKGGYCGIVIPSGIYTDLGTKQLREMLFDENKITGLFGFENRKEIFENVHRSFKFVVLSFEKGKASSKFPCAFMRHDVEELTNFPQYGSVTISVDLVKKLSPDSYSIIEFKGEQEVSIAETVSKYPMLAGDADGWNLELYGEEMNMTRSAGSFLTKPAKFVLYEGGMIWHFTNQFADARYWITEKEIKVDFLSKRVKRIEGLYDQPKDLKNDYETYRLAIRKIASNTNERTLISTIIPKYAIAGNSLTVNFPFRHDKKKYNELYFGNDELFVLSSILNSYVADFILRARVTTNLNLFYLYQLPVPRLKPKDKWFTAIVERAARLICTTEEFAELWEEVMKTKWTEKKAATQEYERSKLRAELDGIIAHIYGLSEEEFAYILSTFPIVSQPQKVATQNAYRDVERGLIKPN
ncbi:MAG: ATP-binding protein [Sphingobacteriales bacterium]|nr:MAG: ATP-binding protein [Sphingobacteriales bacterium]